MNLDHAEVYASKDEWLEGRRSSEHGPSISCSDIASILIGEEGGAFADGWSVWARHRAPELFQKARAELSDDTLEDLARGNHYEQGVLSDYANRTKRILQWQWPTPYVIFGGVGVGAGWLRGSPDHFAREIDVPGLGGVEAKTDRRGYGYASGVKTVIDRLSPEASRLLPARVIFQVMGYLAVTGAPWWDVAAAIPSRAHFIDLRVIRVMRDHRAIQRMLDKLNDWRERHLIQGAPPPFSASMMCRRWSGREPLRAGKVVEQASAREAELVRTYDAENKLVRHHQRLADSARNELVASVGDDYGRRLGERPSSPRALVPEVNKESVSLRRIEKEAPELYNQLKAKGLISKSTSRQMRVYGL